MKQRINSLIENEFIREPERSISLGLLNTIFDDMFFNTDNELSHLKGYEYVYALLDYGSWQSAPDLFKYVRKKCIKLMKRKTCFFIFDASNEGFSPTGYFSIFDYLYSSCDKHGIDPGMIIYLTGNLEDEKNMKNYAEKHNCKPFHVVSFPAFEVAVTETKEATGEDHRLTRSPNDFFNLAKLQCQENYTNKYFSSLSRINRHYRMIATFMLCQRKISRHALISHDVIDHDTQVMLKMWARTAGYNDFAVSNWANKLPFTVDHTDFSVNWAVEVPYGHIHDRTLFQIVNETQVENFGGTSMFYSEKTFKPVLKCQPFLIYGQRGCNHKLKDLGYKLYDEWFDLSFDWEEDDVLRYKKMLASIEKTCKYLNTLSRTEQIEWRFKNKELMTHNCKVMLNSAYTKNKLYQFFKNLQP